MCCTFALGVEKNTKSGAGRGLKRQKEHLARKKYTAGTPFRFKTLHTRGASNLYITGVTIRDNKVEEIRPPIST